MGGGQPHSRQQVPGPRLPSLGRLQRRDHQGPDGGLARPRADLRQGGHDHPALPGRSRDHLCVPGDRRRRRRLRLGCRVPAERRREHDLRRPLYRRRPGLWRVRPGHDRDRSSRRGVSEPALPQRYRRELCRQPAYAGHLYLTYEDWDPSAGQADVKFTQSTDGGSTWTAPVVVTANVDTPGLSTDQFQPTVAAGPTGAVAVAFYDRREACPTDPSVLPADVARVNFCIDTSLQAYKDNGAGAVPVGANVRISDFTWDPEQPGQHLESLSQYPCASARDPGSTGSGFIGDYFALAISGGNIYALMVSTHYPLNRDRRRGRALYCAEQGLGAVSG